MSQIKVIDVFCKNGHLLFGRYRKVKSGFLMKCYLDEIGIDYVGVKDLPLNRDVYCPFCAKQGVTLRIGRKGIVHGRQAVVVNHGGIKRIKT